MRKNKSRSTEKEEGRRIVNTYGEKKNIDEEYGREGMLLVSVNNERIGESNSGNYNLAFALFAQRK